MKITIRIQIWFSRMYDFLIIRKFKLSYGISVDFQPIEIIFWQNALGTFLYKKQLSIRKSIFRLRLPVHRSHHIFTNSNRILNSRWRCFGECYLRCLTRNSFHSRHKVCQRIVLIVLTIDDHIINWSFLSARCPCPCCLRGRWCLFSD